MSLLLDEIREYGVISDPYKAVHFNWQSVETMIDRIAQDDRVQVFDVSPAGVKFLNRELSLNDLPSFRLPFRACWFECHEKDDMSKVKSDLAQEIHGMSLAWGMYVEEADAADLMTEWNYMDGLWEDDAVATVHVGTLFCSWGNSRAGTIPAGPIASWVLGLRADGTFAGEDDDRDHLLIHIVPMSETIVEYCRDAGFGSDVQVQAFIATNYIMPLYCGVGLLNIRNISTEVITRPPKLQQARIRRKKPPFVSYHTLVVRPLSAGKNYQQSSKSQPTGFTMPFHTVRGHPVTYRESAPRFGRLSDGVGTFWIEGHARGLKSSGETRKDYQVDPETERKSRVTRIERDETYRGPEMWREITKPTPTNQKKRRRR